MSAFQQSMKKLSVRAGLLAGTSAAVLAIAGIGAGSAVAAPTCGPESVHIKGMGSSLQKVAQEVWTGREVKTVTNSAGIPEEGTANALANSYRAKCAAKAHPPTVTYGSSGSGPALEAFRFTGSNAAIDHNLAFIGSDDAPTRAQITHAEEVAGGAKAVVVPVSQTAIAVDVHPPAGCIVEEITWKDLNKVFGGNGIKKWNEFETKEEEVAGACNATLSRVVRAESSGTTYQFKNYLSELEQHQGAEGLPCTTQGTNNWAGLRESGTGGQPNISWPQCTGGTTVITAAGGGAVAEKVATTVNTIGYSALPDSKAKSAEVALLQNGVLSGAKTYASPGAGGTAHCANSRYTVPAAAGTEPGGRVGESGISVNWSTVFGAQPEIGGSEYPLCTLTFQIGWTNYESAGYGAGSAATIGALVTDFVKNYEVAEGNTPIAGKWYSALPSTTVESNKFNVKGAAELAASKLG